MGVLTKSAWKAQNSSGDLSAAPIRGSEHFQTSWLQGP